MPNFFRTHDGRARKASNLLPLTLPDGAIIEDVWAGSAMEEKLSWWLSRSGHQLTQSEEISKIASKADDNGEIIWGATPAGGRLFFVLLPPPTGKTYRLAKLVTTSATLAQAAYFRHERAALFGQSQAGRANREDPSPGPASSHPESSGRTLLSGVKVTNKARSRSKPPPPGRAIQDLLRERGLRSARS